MKILLEGSTMKNAGYEDFDGPKCDCIHCPVWCEYSTSCWRDGD